MSRPKLCEYYGVDGSPACEGVKEAGSDAPLADLAELAFTGPTPRLASSNWTKVSDFYTLLTGNYITTGDKRGYGKH